jgi:hypothetical protein
MSAAKLSEIRPVGVGMPHWLLLNLYGLQVHQAFGHYPFLVGSALRDKHDCRDIDVRLMLPTDDYLRMAGPIDECGKTLTRWSAVCLAWSVLGRQMTGLPIDFQIQTVAHEHRYEDQPRLQIGVAQW